MRRRTRLVASAACGVLAALLAAAGAESARAQARQERSESLERYGSEQTTLVVARRELASGSTVSEGDVEERDWLSDLAPEGALTSLDDVVGTRLTSPVAKGAPLTQLDFASGEGDVEVPEGRVAVSVRIGDRAGVPADVPAGSRALLYEAAEGGARLVCSDATVLGGAAGSSYAGSDRALTVAIRPDEVSRVLSASFAGSLRFALPADDVAAPEDGSDTAPTSVAAETGGGA